MFGYQSKWAQIMYTHIFMSVIYHKSSLQLNLSPNCIHAGLLPHATKRNVRDSIVAADVIILQSVPLAVRRRQHSR